jgi:hypothetical protein
LYAAGLALGAVKYCINVPASDQKAEDIINILQLG